MKNISFENVTLNDGFLRQKELLNENVTINAVYDRFYDTGRITAFECNWKEGMDPKPHFFWDSDVAKWIEGAANILTKKSSEDLENKIEWLIDKIEENQDEHGYFNIYFTVVEPENRFTRRDAHELYCAGHLMEAAIAYHRATGKDRFLKAMEKYADYIEKCFITEKTAKFTTPGHEEIELALLKMYKHTNNEKYLNMAKFFIDNRGLNIADPPIADEYIHENTQSHIPVREQKEAMGHSVRACYLYTAMAELAAITCDKELLNAAKTIFSDIVNKKMYITGGLGSTRIGEAFTNAYDLPNDKAYAETCASISMMLFAHRMQETEINSVYADVIEREIYNGMLSGISLDGKAFFYENPLELDLNNYKRFTSTAHGETYGITQRQVVFGCSCCPPNINRIFSSLGDYIYATDKDSIFINQFTASTVNVDGMHVEQKTEYPLNGKVTVISKNVKKLYVRIPSWCDKYEISAPYTVQNGYALIENPEESISIEFNMVPRLWEANTKVSADAGKVALSYGPVVYCMESVDNTENLSELYIDKNLEYSAEYDDFFGCFTLEVSGLKKVSGEGLYSPFSENFEKTKIKLIPFYGHANRGESNMCVWMKIR